MYELAENVAVCLKALLVDFDLLVKGLTCEVLI